MLKLISISAVKTEKQRVDGKPSRHYYTIKVTDVENPFGGVRSATVFQNHVAAGNGKYTIGWTTSPSPEILSEFVGKQIKGSIAKIDVPNTFTDANGVEINTVSQTVVLLGNTTVKDATKAALTRLGTPVVSETAKSEPALAH